MKKTITLPTAKRAEYLIPMLNSLKSNNLNGYKLYINCEPFDDVINLCKKIDFIETDILINEEVLGVRKNPFNCLRRAFNQDELVFNIHIEEDLIFSPDMLNLANWYCNNYVDDPLRYLAYGFFNYDSSSDEEDTIISIPKFNGLGWCCFSENWYQYFMPVWFDDELNKKVWGPLTHGWDHAVDAVRKINNLETLIPTLSRSNHIGREGGTYCTADFHDKIFTNLIISDSNIKEFKIV